MKRADTATAESKAGTSSDRSAQAKKTDESVPDEIPEADEQLEEVCPVLGTGRVLSVAVS